MNIKTKNFLIGIPTYKPNDKFINLILEIVQRSDLKILIYNDGSPKFFNKIFQSTISISKKITFIENDINYGKGYSIKRIIEYSNKKKFDGTIFFDSDSQHKVEDLLKMITYAKNNCDSMIIGQRNFTIKNTPLLNFLGNKFSAFLISLKINTSIIDSQTGLRFLPKKAYEINLSIEANRFEFETISLIKYQYKFNDLRNIYISIVYSPENKSNFRKIIDSSKILNSILFTKN